MANCMIGFPNRIDQATLSGGSWQSTLPLTNLKDRTIGKVARSTNASTTSTKFDIDFGASKNIRIFALVNHNASLFGLVRVTASDSATFSTLVYDSGWLDIWPVVYPSGSLDWEDDNWWSGKYTDEQRAGYTPTRPLILPTNTLARYWRVEIDDTSNADGYVQIGRVFIGAVYQPTYNMGYGAVNGWETNTQIMQSLGGAEYFQRRTPYRVVKTKLDFMDEAEAFGNVFEITRRAGIDAEIVWIHDPSDTVHALRRQFLARMTQMSQIDYPYPLLHGAAFDIKELL